MNAKAAVRLGAVTIALGAALVTARAAPQADAGAPQELAPDPDLVVIDAGHGGPDYGARGPRGVLEKDVVLAVALKLGAALEGDGFRVIYTRERDEFVSLPERTDVANDARAGLYLSIHANASSDSGVRGAETYFLSVNASDEEAYHVAVTENGVFDRPDAAADSGDVVAAILGDLIRIDHLRESSDVAFEIQQQLDELPGPGRGVKQAPFVVLMRVNMPAALLEIGFLTHPKEERKLASRDHQRAIAGAVAAGVRVFRDGQNGDRRSGSGAAAEKTPPPAQAAEGGGEH
ncbi:MAG: N-acetylmuramoyl-L-alanine amidase [Deltaproteobacteria bacterium]|nr:N-acetylmuramoyl-L-alanine amidase [Deltaproteobacteria bacterium]MBW2414055.1 N-acetylmuramoyl-L-alanine amidase [Deltaproteobacteria bacterium]